MSEYEVLRAGALSMLFDPTNGQLRRIGYAGREVLRGIYGAIRDREWGTVAPRLEDLSIERGEDHFHVAFTAHCRRDEIDFRWRGVVVGQANSTLTYMFQGEALSNFLRSRIGLCVLHPIRECAGQPCRVTHADGSPESTHFPLDISADQPFFNVAALRHPVADGLDALVEFSGDVFETEDQRNWTDASYKTYSTPLELPYPVEVRAGDTVRQQVTLRLIGVARQNFTSVSLDRRLSLGPRLQLPRVGFSHPGRSAKLSDRDIARLQSLNPGHLRVEVRLSDSTFAEDLSAAAADARALSAPLQVVLILSGRADEELNHLIQILRSQQATVSEWIVIHRDEESTSERWVRLVRERLQDVITLPRIGCGTNDYFAELNRHRPTLGVADLLTYSVNPQVHATDDDSIAEALAGQAATARTVGSFAGDASIHIGPITLKPRKDWRSNPDGVATGSELPPDADLRQASTFLAGWTLGSIAALAREGVHAATYYELVGCRGLMGCQDQAGLPEPFATIGAGVFPVYHLFADLAELADGECIVTECALPDAFAGLLFKRAGRCVALLANLTSEAQRWTLPFRADRIRVLDSATQHAATQNPAEYRNQWRTGNAGEIELPVHAYLRVEGTVP